MRGLKRDHALRIVTTGHAFVQNLRRGHYELATEPSVLDRVAVAFTELASPSDRPGTSAASACPAPAQRNKAAQGDRAVRLDEQGESSVRGKVRRFQYRPP